MDKRRVTFYIDGFNFYYGLRQMKKLLPIFIFIIFFASCTFNNDSNSKAVTDYPVNDDSDSKTVIDCPAEIAARAFRFAELYKNSDTIYEWGGQDPVRSAIAIDCSGLVVMCYKYAMVDTKYSLLLPDMTAGYMYESAASIVPLEKISQGDLIFMGEATSSKVTHIALFDCIANDCVYFIDSTEKDDISGVTRRFYETDDTRFKAFGVMRVQY